MRQKKTSSKAASGTAAVNRRRLLNNESPFAIKEAYVKLRTSLMFCMTADKERTCKTFAITSSKPSEGKSLTAANVAISYAMLGKKVLLIDADMRKPTQRRLWKVELTVGLCDFLAKIWKLEIAKVQDLPLWIVCTGTIPPNPSELLASDRMKVFVRECAKVYDYVIIDTPPINTVADAQIAAAYVDGVVLVAKSGYTSADELMAAIDAVHQVGGNLCGVVLNDLNMKSVKYSYKYKYGDKYGYKYGYTRLHGRQLQCARIQRRHHAGGHGLPKRTDFVDCHFARCNVRISGPEPRRNGRRPCLRSAGTVIFLWRR